MIRKGYVDTAEGQIHYHHCPGGTGDPLVFFHMTASSADAYDPLMRALDGRFPMIAFDTVNYGESYRTDRPADMAYIARVKLEALSNMGIERFHTFGHHTGVSIQVEMAGQAPERVASLIINGPMYLTAEEMTPFSERLAKPNPIDVKGTQFMRAWSRTKDNMALPMMSDVPHAAEVMNRDTIDMLRAGEDWSWGYRAVFEHDLKAAMRKVRCPMFLVSGALDGCYDFHLALAADYPAAKVHVNPEGAVFYAETHATELAPHVADFIASLAA